MKKVNIWVKYRNKRRVIVFISILIVVFLYAFKNYSNIARVSSAVGLLVIFYMVDHFFDLDFGERHYVYILLITISGFLFSPLYTIFSTYDKILHFVMPILFASIGFHMVNKLKLEMKWKLTFVFFIVVGSLGIFEIGEYVLDYFFEFRLQGVFLRDLDNFGSGSLVGRRVLLT